LGLIISETIHFSKKVLRTKVVGLKVLPDSDLEVDLEVDFQDQLKVTSLFKVNSLFLTPKIDRT